MICLTVYCGGQSARPAQQPWRFSTNYLTNRYLMDEEAVNARCRQVMGTVHGIEVLPFCCPDISADTARDLAAFCKG
jgi:hypothetical protein